MKTTTRDSLIKARRIVVKVGSNVLTREDGLNLDVIAAIGRQVSLLMEEGREVILVSSGAMAAGLRKVGLSRRPDEIPKRQAIAAVGQAGLILAYEQAFEGFGRKVAQILLTSDGLTHRKRYLNARNTLNTLLDWGVIPIINENDTVSIDEIKFGDNDSLSAMIALLMDAAALVNLTDIDGLYDRDPRVHPEAVLIPEVSVIGRDIERLASDIPGALGTGGMVTKIRAARKATAAGIPVIIAGGRQPDILLRLFAGERLGTYFVPRGEKLNRRKCWIGYTLRPKGVIRVDSGAAIAVRDRGKSLLPSGIVAVEGEFGAGAPVEVVLGSEVIGTGLVNYSAGEIRAIMGLKSEKIQERLGHKSYDEVIHRDNLVITAQCPS